MKRVTFKHAHYETPYGGTYTIERYLRNTYTGLLFCHLVVEYIFDGRCVRRHEVHPWEAKFSMLGTMRMARKLCFGKKINHVKT